MPHTGPRNDSQRTASTGEHDGEEGKHPAQTRPRPRAAGPYHLRRGHRRCHREKELPFVVGVLGDFSGNPLEPLPKLKDRKFVFIDRDNFNGVLKGIKPRLTYRVDNTLAKNGTQLGVELNFNSLEDFEPQNVVKQVEPLRKLLEVRNKLADLRNKMGGNDKLEELLMDVLQNTEKLKTLGKEFGREAEVKDPSSSDRA